MRTRSNAGFSLIETLLSLFLIGIGLLAVAPLFISAMHGNAAGGDFGSAGALAAERLERLRELDYIDLVPGGSLSVDVTGYTDATNPGFAVRWEIADHAGLHGTRTIRVRVLALGPGVGPRREVTLSLLRAV